MVWIVLGTIAAVAGLYGLRFYLLARDTRVRRSRRHSERARDWWVTHWLFGNSGRQRLTDQRERRP